MEAIAGIFGFNKRDAAPTTAVTGPTPAEKAAQIDARNNAIEKSRAAAEAVGGVPSLTSLRRQLSFNTASLKQKLGG